MKDVTPAFGSHFPESQNPKQPHFAKQFFVLSNNQQTHDDSFVCWTRRRDARSTRSVILVVIRSQQ